MCELEEMINHLPGGPEKAHPGQEEDRSEPVKIKKKMQCEIHVPKIMGFHTVFL
jgi:hypothetical protein